MRPEALLPGEPAVRSALVREAWRLVERIEGSHRQVADGCALSLLGPDMFAEADLSTARQYVHRRYGQFPLAAFLVAVPDRLDPQAGILDRLRSWILCAALAAIADIGPDHTTWQFAARAMRRLCSNSALVESRRRLPEIAADDLQHVRARIEEWIPREHEAGTDFAHQLDHVARALAQLAGQPRRRIGPGARAPGASRILADKCLAQPAGRDDGQIQLSFGDFDFEAEDLLSLEEAADVARPLGIRLPLVDPTLPADAQGVAADLEVLENLFDAGGVSVASGHLTQSEARQLASALRREFLRGNAPAALVWLTASLLTGRRLDDLAALSGSAGAPGTSWWSMNPLGLAFAPAVTRAPPTPKGAFIIHFPDWLQAPLRAAILSGQTPCKASIAAWLSRGKIGPGRTPRLSRIERALPHALGDLGTDSVIIALLEGADIRHSPQVYYTSLDCTALDATYRWFLQDWLGLSRQEGGKIAPAAPSAPAIGSRLVPRDEEIAAFFASRRVALRTAAQRLNRHEPGAAHEYHGAFVHMAAAILSFCTGLRPHGLACPSFTALQLAGAWPVIRIQDKGNRRTDDARWLPVPGLLQQTIVALREQLQHVEEWGRLFQPEVAQAARHSLEGGMTPLWHLPEPLAVPVPLSAREYWTHVDPPGAARNALRHFWRTTLAHDRVPGWQIDYWMGHGGWGSAQYLPMSGFAAADLGELTQALEDHIDTFAIVPPEPRALVR